MVKLERDADAKVPTKVINTNIDAMIAPMASTFSHPLLVLSLTEYILLIDRHTVKFFVIVVIEESMFRYLAEKPVVCFCLPRDL